MNLSSRLVVLDRDGVLNEDSPAFIKSADEWHPIPGALDAVVRLNRAGFRVVVATNQSGLGRGKFSYQALFQMHAKCERALARLGGRIDGWFFCPHHPDAHCLCRKPATGLYDQIARRFDALLSGPPDGRFRGVLSVGDALRDVQAARSAGAEPALVRTGKGRDTERALDAKDVPVFDDLCDVVDTVLGVAG